MDPRRRYHRRGSCVKTVLVAGSKTSALTVEEVACEAPVISTLAGRQKSRQVGFSRRAHWGRQ